MDLENITGPIARRTFLRTATGLIAATIVSPGAVQAKERSNDSKAGRPGVAPHLIDARKKVTGAKFYARDFYARDVKGWPKEQWYALYLCATTTRRPFLDVNMSGLPSDAMPAKVILGNNLTASIRAPALRYTRDFMVEQTSLAHIQREAALTLGGRFSSPIGADLLVKPGATPTFLGQGVALLLFSTLAAYRAARRAMQFRDDDFQVYGPDNGGAPGAPVPYSPQTQYVKYFRDGENFSYATRDDNAYKQSAPTYRAKIIDYLKSHEGELFRQPVTLDTQAMDPMFMEPETGLSWHNKDAQRLELLLGTQSPDGDIATISSMFGATDSPIKLTEIRLTNCPPGGAFGGRDASPFTLLLALVAPFAEGHPVRLMHDRFDQFRLGLKRPGAKMTGAITVGSDMSLQCVQMTMNFNGGGLKNLSPYVANLAALAVGGAYAIPMASIDAQSMQSQDIPGGSQRGFGGPEAFFAIETALDDIAAAKSWDPLALRRANLAQSTTATVVGGQFNQELRLNEILDKTEAHPLWAQRANLKAEFAARGETYGTGFALSAQAYGTSADGVVAAIHFDKNGSITIRTDAVDFGNGSSTTLSVVVGPILGVNAQAVVAGDYTLFGQTGLAASYTPDWDNPLSTAKGVGSSSACLTGFHQVHVVQETARAFMQSAILPAARLLWNRPHVAYEDVAWVEGRLSAKRGDLEPLTHARLAQAIYSHGLPSGVLGHAFFQGGWVSGSYAIAGSPITLELDGLTLYSSADGGRNRIDRTKTGKPLASALRSSRTVWAPCANIVGLVVDRSTGTVRIENVASILNAGHVHVPELVSGQSQGGVAMAIGYTLLEDMPDGLAGPASGAWNLNRYHVPRMADVPHRSRYKRGHRAQELITLPETPQDSGRGRGIAEAVMCSIAPAISNALRDALGVRYSSLPITPAKILSGLQQ
ncbi:CO or xanthine dehydrogenase, Mo-binding subunit [Bradyrhizobium erythrophlei]|nr:CO or xanthine dehydrogenase, Mo-binding subunit [Bradyrhizobium erythrophlei]